MLKPVSRILVALLVLLGTTTYAPPASSALLNEIYTEYYDCNVEFTGWQLVDCEGYVTSDGAQSGYFKMVQRTRCDGSSWNVRWYNCSSGSCTLMSSPPTPPPPGTYYC